MTPTGYVLWKGTSHIDKKTPVVCIMTMNSKNEKTGDMVQVWILLQNVSPMDGVKQNLDHPICGMCVHRIHRTCYVEIWQAPTIVWKAWKRGHYPLAPTKLNSLLRFRAVRIGAYGDPAAVPPTVWNKVVQAARSVTGYTHQWRTHPKMAAFCMASVESLDERREAKALGFRTFRVTKEPERVVHEEVMCPGAKKAGVGLQCIDCGHCNGTSTGLIGDVTNPVHGNRAKRFLQIPVEHRA